jgi:molybdopterin molybdotransferase
VRLAISRDDRADLERNLRAAMECELVLLSGGVSMGKYDLVEQALGALGAEFYFTGVRMQPGRPVVFGKLPEGPYFFGLPGNPVSTEVTFRCFAGPLLRGMGGASKLGPRFALARLAEAEPAKTGLHRLLPARMTASLDGVEVKLVGWKGSGDMAANARANCYAVFPPERGFAAGDVVSVLLR